MVTVNFTLPKNAKYVLLTLISVLIYNRSYSQIKRYQLIDETLNANIDRGKFELVNKLGSGYHLLNKVFKPSKWIYTVYRFVAEFKGLSHETEKEAVFHDLLVLKTNNKGTIVDAYQYTLEWAEMPLTYDLYKLTVSGLKLRDDLKLNAFKFKRIDNDSSPSDQYLQDNGYLSLNNSKQ